MKQSRRRWALACATLATIGTAAVATTITPQETTPKPTEDWTVSVEEPWFILQIEEDFGLAFTMEGVTLLESSAIMDCVNAAKAACGDGNICWIRVRGGPSGETCEFACRDSEGNCTPMPSEKQIAEY